ncbi:MAG: SDR family oxidoreductase [Candidatus Omnitrophica bacterium]|nr:SDR family oxidoreductase [Candidatus Omnitrophota bacterium]
MVVTLEGKKILATGATGAIGRSFLEHALEAGAWTAGAYHQSEGEAVLLRGKGVFMLQADLRDRLKARNLIQEVLRECGSLDALVYSAGNVRDRTLLKMTDEEWDDVLRLHLEGLYACAQAVLPSMKARRSGQIVAIASLSGLIGRAGQANYSAAKAGTIGFIKSLAREAGRFGVRANAVCPGFVDSRMTKQAPPEAWERAKADSALGTISTAQVVGSFVTWLLSEHAEGITGQVFHLDSRIP